MKKLSITYFLDELERMFPDARCELNFTNPFQLVVSVILSAQTTDKQVNKVTGTLYKKIKTPIDIINMGLENFEKEIKSIGLYKSKAKNIYNLSMLLARDNLGIVLTTVEGKKIYNKYGYIIPDNLEELVKLPGIGIKTAKVVLFELYGAAVMPVDTHIHRIANRLGFVNTINADKTSELLEKLVPNSYKKRAHHLMIFFGRYFCTAKNPKCEQCIFKEYCKYYDKINELN